MSQIYIPQILKVKILLEAKELCPDYEEIIRRKLIDTYGNHCYQHGYIKKSSIKVLKIENGACEGSHLRGVLTFNVEFSALFCIPIKDTDILCRVISNNNKFGVVCYTHPIEIMIPRQLQTYAGNIELLKDLMIDDYLLVKIKDYTIEKNRLIAVGIAIDKDQTSPNHIELPLDGLLTNLVVSTMLSSIILDTPLTKSKTPPLPNTEKLGSNDDLKTLISNTDLNALKTVQAYINDYQYVGNFSDKNTVVNYQDNNNMTNIYDPENKWLHPVGITSYFILWEILTDTHIMDAYMDTPLKVLLISKRTSEMVQCLVNWRNRQYQTDWKNDTYSRIDNVMHLKDKAEQFMGKLIQLGYRIQRLIRNMSKNDFLKIDMIQSISQMLNQEKQDLIIISLISDSESELNNAKHLTAQVILTLMNQAENGSLILMLGEIYYEATLQLLYLLSLCYDEMILFKPKISDPISPIKYLICHKFRGINSNDLKTFSLRFKVWMTSEKSDSKDNPVKTYITQLLTFAENPNSKFLESIRYFNKYVSKLQFDAISKGIELLKFDQKQLDHRFEEQIQSSRQWCQKYQIPTKSTQSTQS